MFNDCLGNEVTVGSRIIYPTKKRNSKIVMRRAVIRYFKIDKSGLKVSVSVNAVGDIRRSYITTIKSAFANCVRV